MSTVITKQETKQVVVGFDSGGCTHAAVIGSGIFCHLLAGDKMNPHVTCNQSGESCECLWDQEHGSWFWTDV